MSINEITATLTELQELKRLREELDQEITRAEDAIKAHMTEANIETMTAGAFRVTWRAITSSRLDAAAMKKELPELVQRFMKPSTVRRFTVN